MEQSFLTGVRSGRLNQLNRKTVRVRLDKQRTNLGIRCLRELRLPMALSSAGSAPKPTADQRSPFCADQCVSAW